MVTEVPGPREIAQTVPATTETHFASSKIASLQTVTTQSRFQDSVVMNVSMSQNQNSLHGQSGENATSRSQRIHKCVDSANNRDTEKCCHFQKELLHMSQRKKTISRQDSASSHVLMRKQD